MGARRSSASAPSACLALLPCLHREAHLAGSKISKAILDVDGLNEHVCGAAFAVAALPLPLAGLLLLGHRAQSLCELRAHLTLMSQVLPLQSAACLSLSTLWHSQGRPLHLHLCVACVWVVGRFSGGFRVGLGWIWDGFRVGLALWAQGWFRVGLGCVYGWFRVGFGWLGRAGLGLSWFSVWAAGWFRVGVGCVYGWHEIRT